MSKDGLADMHTWAGMQRLREPEGTEKDLALQDLRGALRKTLPPETFPVGSPQRLLAEREQKALLREAQRLGYEPPKQRAKELALEAAVHVGLGL